MEFAASHLAAQDSEWWVTHTAKVGRGRVGGRVVSEAHWGVGWLPPSSRLTTVAGRQVSGGPAGTGRWGKPVLGQFGSKWPDGQAE